MTIAQHFNLSPHNYFPVIASILMIALSIFARTVPAANLKINPVSPTIAIGQSIQLSVSGAEGKVTWIAENGEIMGKNSPLTTYVAPQEVGLYDVTASDENGNSAVVKVTVLTEAEAKQAFSVENAQWEVFTNRGWIKTFALSQEGTTLWIGTDGGLEKYDITTGNLIRIFKTVDGLPSNGITNLVSDNNGGLWIGTARGLAHLSASDEWQSDIPPRLSSDDRISALISDGNNGLWVSINGYYWTDENNYGIEIIHFNNNKELKVFQLNAAAHEHYPISIYDFPFALANDGNGGVWIGTLRHGLAHLTSNGEYSFFTIDNSDLPGNFISSLASNEHGELWMGVKMMEEYEATSIPLDYFLVHLSSDGEWTVFPDYYVETLVSDGSRGVWIGSDHGLIYLNDNGDKKVFNTNNSELPNNYITTLISDNKGGLWMGGMGGMWGGSIAHLSSTEYWKIISRDNVGELPDNSIAALLSDDQGGLWIGTHNGLAYLSHNQEWRVFDLREYGSSMVRALAQDDSNGLWITTHDSLIHKTNNDEWREVLNINSFSPSDINTFWSPLVKDNKGLWMTMGSPNDVLATTSIDTILYLSNSGERQIFTLESFGLSNDHRISDMVSDGYEGVWIGTTNRSNNESNLIHLNINAEPKISEFFPGNMISSFFGDSSGRVWAWADNVDNYNRSSLYLNSNGEWKIINEVDHDVDNFISDGANGWWTRSFEEGVSHLNSDGSWTNLGVFGYTLESDKRGGLWIGSSEGLTHLTFGQKSNVCKADATKEECKELLKSKGAAILIHPQGSNSKYKDKEGKSLNFMANYAYQILSNRGYKNDEIYYLAYKPDLDVNGDTYLDSYVDAPVTLTQWRQGTRSRDLNVDDINQAFQWAKEQSQLAKNQGLLEQPLVVIFIGHGLNDNLILDPLGNNLSGIQFKAFLDDYQAQTGNSVVIIIEACYSGTLINALSAPNRLIISSTNDRLAYYSDFGRSSFLKYYLDQLDNGVDYWNAWQHIRALFAEFNAPRNEQDPQLEDQLIGNKSMDLFLNGSFGNLVGFNIIPFSLPPVVSLNTPLDLSVIIKENQSKENQSPVDRVEVIVTTPTSESTPQGYIYNTLSVELEPKENERWEGPFEQFTVPGKYTFIFKAYYRSPQGDQSKEADEPITICVPGGEPNCSEAPKPPPPDIPNLPNLGGPFRGGTTVDGQTYKVHTPVSLSQPVVITGEIEIDDIGLNQLVDIVAFATYLPEPNNPNNKLFYMLDSNGVPVSWDGDMAHLMTFKPVNLPKHQKVDIYNGILVPGKLIISFGYRFPNGIVTTNATPIEVDVFM